MVRIEALRLFILGINCQRINGNFGSSRTPYCIPQQGAPEFTAMIGKSDGQAPQARDRYRGIAWHALGESDWHRREENPARG